MIHQGCSYIEHHVATARGVTLSDLDSVIASLSDEKNISKVRADGESKLSNLSTEQIKYLRKRCKLDLFFLAYAVLGYNKLSKNLHGHFCAWLMRNRTARFREELLPRGHYKSTIVTISDSIRIALPDDTGLGVWPECLGTNCRILVGHETLEQASKFLVSIAGHFLSNPLLMALFPECVPTVKKHRINKYELELPRSEIWPEPTFDTMGVGGKSQGRHYNHLKLDDLIGDKARDSKTEMQTAKDWIDNIQAFFSDFLQDKLDLTGTRWGHEDLYHHVHTSYGPAMLKYIRAAEEYDATTDSLQPIFPEAFTTESFAIIKQNKRIWSAQYANNPEASANEFAKSWKRFYQWVSYNKIAVFSGDASTSVDVMELDRCILIDPAVSGEAGFIVTGGDSKERIFTLLAKKHNWRPPELVDYLFEQVSRWQPRVVAIEEVLFSALFFPWLKREMQVRGVYFNCIPVKTRGREKDARTRGLANFFAAGNIFFHESQTDLIYEYDIFGSGAKYHLLDALAYGPEVWGKPFSVQTMQDHRAAEEELLAQRDIETGY